MRLTQEQIESYKELYRDTFGEDISDEDAYQQGLALLRLVKALMTEPNDDTNKENKNEPKRTTT